MKYCKTMKNQRTKSSAPRTSQPVQLQLLMSHIYGVSMSVIMSLIWWVLIRIMWNYQLKQIRYYIQCLFQHIVSCIEQLQVFNCSCTIAYHGAYPFQSVSLDLLQTLISIKAPQSVSTTKRRVQVYNNSSYLHDVIDSLQECPITYKCSIYTNYIL